MGADTFLNHPDPLTREVARGYAGGSFLMDNGQGLQWYTVSARALVPLGSGLHARPAPRRKWCPLWPCPESCS